MSNESASIAHPFDALQKVRENHNIEPTEWAPAKEKPSAKRKTVPPCSLFACSLPALIYHFWLFEIVIWYRFSLRQSVNLSYSATLSFSLSFSFSFPFIIWQTVLLDRCFESLKWISDSIVFRYVQFVCCRWHCIKAIFLLVLCAAVSVYLCSCSCSSSA